MKIRSTSEYIEYGGSIGFENTKWIFGNSPNSFPAIGVLAVLIEGPVVISLSRAAKYRSPFAVIYMNW